MFLVNCFISIILARSSFEEEKKKNNQKFVLDKITEEGFVHIKMLPRL